MPMGPQRPAALSMDVCKGLTDHALLPFRLGRNRLQHRYRTEHKLRDVLFLPFHRPSRLFTIPETLRG